MKWKLIRERFCWLWQYGRELTRLAHAAAQVRVERDRLCRENETTVEGDGVNVELLDLLLEVSSGHNFALGELRVEENFVLNHG